MNLINEKTRKTTWSSLSFRREGGVNNVGRIPPADGFAPYAKKWGDVKRATLYAPDKSV